MQRLPSFAVIETHMHILLVEDDDSLATAIRRIFTAEGHVVDCVADGLEGLTQAGMEQYDVFVFDVMLPSLDGFEITRRIRRDGVRTPILLLTARDAVRDRVAGLDAGADDYLVKPFAPQELLARVRALGRRNSPGSLEGQILRVGDLELNLLTREAVRGGKTIDLTAKEFVLLEELMRHAGQVMTRTRLLDTVWNYDVLTDSNVVDMYIHYLRTKIDKDFEMKLIRTVRGAGYAIREG
ncbi:response regulator transcription factor [Candidatus Amarobacter glycogenicus]|uniref:response regulator transcription factor n=1 Tax=Candidatus Amarobacter glycogenicus TaxID=3140699 RepID=UPI0031CC5782